MITRIKNKFSNQGAFLKGIIFLFGGSVVANICSYLYHLVIGRQVSVEVYGEAEAIISLIAIVSVPAMTLVMVAAKYAAGCKADGNQTGSREIWEYLNKKVLKFGLPIFLLLIILTPVIGNFLNIERKWFLIFIWISMYLSFFNAINIGLLNGWQKFKKVSFSNSFMSIVKLISGIGLIWVGLELGGIVGSLLLATIAAYAFTYVALHINILKKDPEQKEGHCKKSIDLVALRKYIIPVFIGNLAIVILGNVDMVLAKHNLDAISAGQYGALTIVSKIIFFGTGIIASVLFSISAGHSHKGDSSLHILKTGLSLVFLGSGVATIIYFLYPKFILGLLFGSKYTNVAEYLGWFAISISLYSLVNVLFQYLLSIQKTKITYVLLTISIFMILSIVIFGTQISTIITIVIVSQLISLASCGYYLLKKVKI